ncbi:MAG: TraB/GumN family protein [Halorientalis sp.]
MSERSAPTPDTPGTPSGEGSVTVLGTAHVSQDSVEEVEQTIEERRPDVVAVELDEGRYRQMKGETPDDMDPSDLLEGNTVFQFLAYWMLSYVQARLGDQFDIEPGADMMAAIESAESLGLGVALVDRNIQTTIQRFWARLSGLEKLQLIGGLLTGAANPIFAGVTVGVIVGFFFAIPAELLGGPFLLGGLGIPATLTIGSISVSSGLAVGLLDAVSIMLAIGVVFGLLFAVLFTTSAEETDPSEIDMAELTDADVVTAMMEEFRQFSPGGAEALIDERDAYIAHNLVQLRSAGYDVVAVVGAGHRAGIQKYLDHPETLPDFESLVGVESGSLFSPFKLFGYLFTLGFLVLFVLLAMAVATGVEGASTGFLIKLFGAWFLINGIISFALAKLAGAHWQSATVGGAVAWFTSINPLLAPGWFAGYVELRYLTVNISDINRLNEILDDEESPIRDIFGRMFDVPLFRLILIVAMTNVGSFVASMLFGFVMLPYFSSQIGGVDAITHLMVQGVQNSLDIILGLLT